MRSRPDPSAAAVDITYRVELERWRREELVAPFTPARSHLEQATGETSGRRSVGP